MIMDFMIQCGYALLLLCGLLLTYGLLEFLAKRRVEKILKAEWNKLAAEQKNFEHMVSAQQAYWAKQSAEFAAFEQSQLADLDALHRNACENDE